VRGAKRLRVPREEEDARRLLVEPVDEREVRAELLAERAEEAAGAVYRDAGPLVDGEIRVGPGGEGRIVTQPCGNAARRG